MDRHAHWEHVYHTKPADQVSWFQPEARLSRQLIESAAPDRTAAIIDVGAGASTLIDGLISAGYRELTVVDLSEAALEIARRRLGPAAAAVTWRAADVLEATFPVAAYDVWHDRAVFHFLTDATDRTRYVDQVRRTVRPGGHVIVATFAEDGPTRCSGLDVARYSPVALHDEFGDDFALLSSHREEHATPSSALQAFTYCLCRFLPRVAAPPAV
ncbi:MAG TPA: class I SAM-dependent methyltransferase [Gemmatimonadaceae bacterium]|nr:class I SAM-dependent methyltransferase [Gemmatimonadaceae bacterium]